MSSKDLQCPGCHQKDTMRRSRQRWYDYAFRIAGMKPYRCLFCNRRFHARVRPTPVGASSQAG